jgi:hypothetical protein
VGVIASLQVCVCGRERVRERVRDTRRRRSEKEGDAARPCPFCVGVRRTEKEGGRSSDGK